jgi:uncharacterized membrane protein
MAQAKPSIGNRIAPARFLVFLVLLPLLFLTYQAVTGSGGWDGAAIAFDAAALVFLASLIPLLRDGTPQSMRAAAKANDANRGLVLVLTTLLGFAAMAAIAGELGPARQGDPAALLKLGGTLLLIWLFANTVYALHYAHLFYTRRLDGKDTGGLDFPGTPSPTYGDFAYFAFTLAMTFQTSDVEIRAPMVRRIALLHGFAAFVFNIGLIAFTINVLAGSSR